MQSLSGDQRTAILYAMAGLIESRRDEIMHANALDLEAANKGNVSTQLLHRLMLTPEKLDTLCTGIRAIAAQKDPINEVHLEGFIMFSVYIWMVNMVYQYIL
ncbi:hypothetical protein B484DRAFT_426239 [Ochromonadaceae sp. CCMP2298]|nr:hypothetical protein B484DRAFT_426239 [Ochromonadaceae sp. CCMP2298]